MFEEARSDDAVEAGIGEGQARVASAEWRAT